jgi:MerR family transcriptional regulator, light-induced transcriptional regulator
MLFVERLSRVCILPDMTAGAGQLRIGELSRRSGVSPELLRAWEHRYGLLRPQRSEGGFRLYSPHDERRVALMRSHLERGLSAAEAARVTLADEQAPAAHAETPALAQGARALADALDAFDEGAAQVALDRLLSGFSVDAVLGDVVLPYLRELGDRWERREASVAQEHFASHILRGRLLGLARGWARAAGPRALLACMPGEQHDLGLIAFGLALRERGWRITFLGPDTPLDTLLDTVGPLQPDAVVLTATTPGHYATGRDMLRRLARAAPLWAAGAGATPALATAIGARLLDVDPLAAAERVAVDTPRLTG